MRACRDESPYSDQMSKVPKIVWRKTKAISRGRKVVADLAASLAELNHLCVEGQDASLEVEHGLANLGIGRKA